MGKKLSAEELNQYSKEDLVTLLLSMQDQVERTQKTMDLMLEQLAVAKQHRFGRSSEKVKMEDAEQLSFFNECDAAADPNVQEPRAETVVPALKKKKQKGKREADLKNFTVRQVRHTLSQAQLQKLFGNRWKQLPNEVYKKLEYHPASYCVVEHHVAVYAGTDNQTIVKADRPAELLRNSLATPSLVSAILNAKYANAMPLRRIEKEFLRRDVHLSEPTMSNWVITCGERYLSLVYDRLNRELVHNTGPAGGRDTGGGLQGWPPSWRQ